MAFWIRDASLTIGNKQYTLGGLNFTFDIPFEDSDEPPVATITVTNLSETTRAGIKKNDPVVLNAGYGTNQERKRRNRILPDKHRFVRG